MAVLASPLASRAAGNRTTRDSVPPAAPPRRAFTHDLAYRRPYLALHERLE